MRYICLYPCRRAGLATVIAFTLLVLLILNDTTLADGRVYKDNDATGRVLNKMGRIGDIDLGRGQITVNGTVYRIDMQNTRLSTGTGQPVDYLSLDKNLLIRFALSNDGESDGLISVIQITGPDEYLEDLNNQ